MAQGWPFEMCMMGTCAFGSLRPPWVAIPRGPNVSVSESELYGSSLSVPVGLLY